MKLGDVCDTASGGTPSRGVIAYYGGDIPWVKSGDQYWIHSAMPLKTACKLCTRAMTLGEHTDSYETIRKTAFQCLQKVDLAGKRVRLLGVRVTGLEGTPARYTI